MSVVGFAFQHSLHFRPNFNPSAREWGQSNRLHMNRVSRRMRLDFAFDPFAILARGAHQFVVQLEAEPEAGRGAEVAAEAQVVFRGAAAAGFLHVGQVGGRDAGHAGDFRLGDVPLVERFAEGFREEVYQRQQVFVWFHGRQW